MTSFEGPYVGIFGHQINDENLIDRIEIPLIQRDYAQGRDTPEVLLIRAEFLSVLMRAISGGPSVGLDFIYGDVKDGTLRPLDGQQRLTTLFLLHWYLASRIGVLDQSLPWTKFDYATRPSARLFCRRIVEHPAPANTTNLAVWIADQWWFQHLWRHDPTIQAMLTMIEAIERTCIQKNGFDHQAAWARLTDLTKPAVWFHVLPIEEAGEGDSLYIKMNSRGRPLTRFENFKARFEQAIEGSTRSKEFSTKIDGQWSDIFWPYRDEENKTDKQIERSFLFFVETLEWRTNQPQEGRLEARAEKIFAPANDPQGTNLDFLISALDAWSQIGDIDVYFKRLFKGSTDSDPADALLLFGNRPTKNLFKACADSYEAAWNSTQRTFGWAETLLLYAAQIHIINKSPNFPRRLRTLRNLTENSTNELRLSAMPSLVACVERFVLADSYEEALNELDTFNSAQIEDEKEKSLFLSRHPEHESVIFGLEDNSILRGSLVCLELHAETIASRAMTFQAIMSAPAYWRELTGALLASGDYSRIRGNRYIRFGSVSETKWWRELLTGGTRDSLISTAKPLAALLDRLSASDQPVIETLNQVTKQWLTTQSSFDWRYYLVKYQVMRSGASGIYVGSGGVMGYQLCMLDRTQMNSWYHDPYLDAIAEQSKAGDSVGSYLYRGYESEDRWMVLNASGTRIRCTPKGFVLDLPPDPKHRKLLTSNFEDWKIGTDLELRIEQLNDIDIEDRVEKCAQFVSRLVEVGL